MAQQTPWRSPFSAFHPGYINPSWIQIAHFLTNTSPWAPRGWDLHKADRSVLSVRCNNPFGISPWKVSKHRQTLPNFFPRMYTTDGEISYPPPHRATPFLSSMQTGRDNCLQQLTEQHLNPSKAKSRKARREQQFEFLSTCIIIDENASTCGRPYCVEIIPQRSPLY